MKPGLVSVAQAARELSTTPLTLRWLMANKEIDLGFVVDRPGQYRKHFIIYRESLDREKQKRGLL